MPMRRGGFAAGEKSQGETLLRGDFSAEDDIAQFGPFLASLLGAVAASKEFLRTNEELFCCADQALSRKALALWYQRTDKSQVSPVCEARTCRRRFTMEV
jgi:hypothetical protein